MRWPKKFRNSIERQFQIPSKLTGGLVSAGDIGYICTVVFLAHFGSRGNRARWIGGGCLLISLACFIVSMPGFIFPTPSNDFNISQLAYGMREISQPQPHLIDRPVRDVKFDVMQEDKQSEVIAYAKSAYAFCEPVGNRMKQVIYDLNCEAETTNRAALALVFTGIVLIGIGHSMPWSLGVPLLDDSVKKHNAPLYFGGVFFIRIVGPVFGFILGGILNRIHVTLDAPEGLTDQDPRWIGAWWLGYLGISLSLLIPSFFLFLFPADAIQTRKVTVTSRPSLPNDDVDFERRTSLLRIETPTVPMEEEPKRHSPIMKELTSFVSSIRSILRSPIYVISLTGRLFDAFSFKGFFVFLPKYLEYHYGMPSHQSGFLLGLSGFVGYAFGTALGSVLTKVLKLDGRRMAFFIVVCSSTGVFLSGLQVLFGCQSVISQIGTVGKEVDFDFSAQPCSSGCFCESTSLFPVCTESGEPFYSPCVAGCKNVNVLDLKGGKFEFTDCACADQQMVSRDSCKDDCGPMIIAYFAVLIISWIVSGIGVIPGVMVNLRSVPEKHRSTGLAFAAFAISLISTFPSPVVFGYIVDTACLSWSSSCNALGTCQLYDAEMLRYRFHLFPVFLRIVAVLFDIAVCYFAKNLFIMQPEKKESILVQRKYSRRLSKQVEEGKKKKKCLCL